MAGISPNLSGTINVSGVNSLSDTLHEQSLSQQYAIYWQKNLFPYVMLRTSVTYFNYGLNQNIGANSWRKEFSPVAELTWKHPYFSLSGSAQRRQTSSNDMLTNLNNDFLTASLRTRLANYPYINAQFQQSDIYNRPDRRERDTRNRSLIAATGYSTRSSNASYSFSLRNTINRLDQRQQKDYQHSVRLNHTRNLVGKAVRTSVGYSLDYRTQHDITPAASILPREIPGLNGLYANDATPDLGALDSITSLADGNTALPTTPPIDIGNGNVNWNLGADLGATQTVNKIYVYTDRPSGNGVRWEVFRSADNIVWNQVTGSTSFFNISFSRYEISFPSDTTRLIKAVNSGLNEVPTVFVTELEALVEIGNQPDIKREQTIHQANLNNTFLLSSKLTAGADVYLRRESGRSLSVLRNETDYAASTRFKFSEALQNGVRYEIDLINFEKGTPDVDKTSSVAYDLQYRPMETLAFLLSAASRHSYIGPMKSQELNNAILRALGDPFVRLHIATEVGYSGNNLYAGNLRYNTFVYNMSVTGGIFRFLDAGVTYGYQHTDDVRNALIRTKNQYSLLVTYRMTRHILMQGNVDLTHDFNNRYISQEYLVSWTASPKLSLSGSAYLTEQYGASRTDRYNAQLQYYVTARTSLLVMYTEYDLTPTLGNRTAAIQAGIRTSF